MVVINKPTTSVLICIFYIINIQTNLHEGFNKSEKVIME
jgi:hypothetical protein